MKSEEQDDPSLKPLANADGEPGFAEPWQAQALAMADILIQSGLFSASSWSEALGRALQDSSISTAVATD